MPRLLPVTQRHVRPLFVNGVARGLFSLFCRGRRERDFLQRLLVLVVKQLPWNRAASNFWQSFIVCNNNKKMSANCHQAKSCPIPTKVLLKDLSQLPDLYSSTPGGTLFSTTPGGNVTNGGGQPFTPYSCRYLLQPIE